MRTNLIVFASILLMPFYVIADSVSEKIEDAIEETVEEVVDEAIDDAKK